MSPKEELMSPHPHSFLRQTMVVVVMVPTKRNEYLLVRLSNTEKRKDGGRSSVLMFLSENTAYSFCFEKKQIAIFKRGGYSRPPSYHYSPAPALTLPRALLLPTSLSHVFISCCVCMRMVLCCCVCRHMALCCCVCMRVAVRCSVCMQMTLS